MPHKNFSYFETSPVRDQNYNIHNLNVDKGLRELNNLKQQESYSQIKMVLREEEKEEEEEEESIEGNYFPTKQISPNLINNSSYKFINQKYPQIDYNVLSSFSPQNQLYSTDLQNTLPSTFDPRNDPNMPHREKVDKWIDQVPVFLLSTPRNPFNCNISEQVWYSECYPGIVPESTSSSNDQETIEYDLHNLDMKDPLLDKDDVLEFQSRKITQFAFEFYHRDIDDPVHKGHPDYRNPGRHPDSRHRERISSYHESTRQIKYVDSLLGKLKDPLGESGLINYLEKKKNFKNEYEVDLLENPYYKRKSSQRPGHL